MFILHSCNLTGQSGGQYLLSPTDTDVANPTRNSITVVPLLKDTVTLSRNKGKLALNYKGYNFWEQVPRVRWMHAVLLLTKGHLSNKDRIFWQKGHPY